MKRQVPLILVFLGGLFMAAQEFIPHESAKFLKQFLLDWIIIIGIFALALGIWSLFKLSVDKIANKRENWVYSYVTLLGLFSMILFGFTDINGESWGYYFVFVATVMLFILAIVQAMASRANKGLFLGLAGLFLLASILIAYFDNAWSFYFMSAEGIENPVFREFFDYILIPILSTMFSLLAFFIASAAYRAFRARNVLATMLLVSALAVMLRFNPYIAFGSDVVARVSTWLMNVPNLAAQRAIVIGIGLGIVATALKVILGIERGYMGKG